MKKVFVTKTFTSASAAIPHIGSQGWVCQDPSHKASAAEHDRVCVLFRKRYDPSDGTPKVPGSYVPVHLFFPLDHLRERPLTEKQVRGVQASDVSGNVMYRWSIDSKYILFPEDYNGDENWDIHRIDVRTGEEKNLTPMEGIKVQMVQKSADDPETILAGPYHPAFGHLVFSEIFFERVRMVIASDKIRGETMNIRVHPCNVSRMRGLNNEIIRKLMQLIHPGSVGIRPDPGMAKNKLMVNGRLVSIYN